MNAPPAIEFIDRHEVSRRVGLKHSALYERVKAGKFPRPARLGPRCVRWVAAEIDQWMRDRLAERDPA